jgi:hypothetical protein
MHWSSSVSLPGGASGGVAISGGLAYVAWGREKDSGVSVIDVTDPDHPMMLGSAVVPGIGEGGSGCGLAVCGSYVYLANDSHVLKVIEAADPLHPHAVGAVGAGPYPWGVAVSGDYAYVSNAVAEGGLQVLDLSSPEHPRVIGGLCTGTAGSALGVAVSDSVVCVAMMRGGCASCATGACSPAATTSSGTGGTTMATRCRRGPIWLAFGPAMERAASGWWL